MGETSDGGDNKDDEASTPVAAKVGISSPGKEVRSPLDDEVHSAQAEATSVQAVDVLGPAAQLDAFEMEPDGQLQFDEETSDGGDLDPLAPGEDGLGHEEQPPSRSTVAELTKTEPAQARSKGARQIGGRRHRSPRRSPKRVVKLCFICPTEALKSQIYCEKCTSGQRT